MHQQLINNEILASLKQSELKEGRQPLPDWNETNIPRLKNDDEFEDLSLDLCRLEWNDPLATDRHGRSGQTQQGVDIFGNPAEDRGVTFGAQCKLRTGGSQPSEAVIEEEVNRAKDFNPPLSKLIIITDASRDAKTQEIVRIINERELKTGGFGVTIWFWETITHQISSYPFLLLKYYPHLIASLTTAPEAERLVDTPLRVSLTQYSDDGKNQPIENALEFRGIQLISNGSRHTNTLETSPDGILYHYCRTDQTQLNILAAHILNHSDQNCPVFVILQKEYKQPLLKLLSEIGCNPTYIIFLDPEIPINQNANEIFKHIFEYGYHRRGSLPTIDISFRSESIRPRRIMVDANWSSQFSPTHFPNEMIWNSYLNPALRNIQETIALHGDGCLVQFRSSLQLPAAFAVGYTFNIRLSRVGVWARETEISDFRQQYWRSDIQPSSISLSKEWNRAPSKKAKSIIVELSTGRNIHPYIQDFVAREKIQGDAWLQIGNTKTDQRFNNIDEDCAVAYANRVGQIFREDISPYGFTDVHLFLCMPSPLAILVGQRLQACGLIHLYWYSNPTYQYAFTLQ